MFLNCAVLGALIRPVFLNESKKVVGDEMDGGQLPDNIDGTPLLIKISQAKDQQTNVNPQPNEQPTSVQQVNCFYQLFIISGFVIDKIDNCLL